MSVSKNKNLNRQKYKKKNEDIVFCHSKQFSSEIAEKYLNGKKIK